MAWDRDESACTLLSNGITTNECEVRWRYRIGVQDEIAVRFYVKLTEG